MERNLNKLDLTLYEETLDHGFHVYVVPNKKVNNIYATLTIRYGSNHDCFIPYKEKEKVSFPHGIAHFLEHKVFEQESGEDPFSFFESRGANCNANTSNQKTTYLFSGMHSFEDNLNMLLDFVEEPYFTEENVEKEKGIIIEELNMYKDNPIQRLYETSIYNTFHSHPCRYSVGGTVESVKKITKEMLYTCYHTFYQPSNMFLIVTGNVDAKEVFEIVKENHAKKKFPKQKKIKLETYQEPDSVFKKREKIKMNVVLPKVSLTFKIRISHIKASLFELRNYIYYFFETKLGSTSLFLETLKNKGILNYDLGIQMVQTEDFLVIMILAETKKTEEFISSVLEEIKEKTILKEELERKKKAMISSYIHMSDSVFALNQKIMNNLITYKEVYDDDFSMIKKLNVKDANEILKQISFENYSIVTVEKDEK